MENATKMELLHETDTQQNYGTFVTLEVLEIRIIQTTQKEVDLIVEFRNICFV